MNTKLKLAALLVGCAGLINACGKQETPPAPIAAPSNPPAPAQIPPATPTPQPPGPVPVVVAATPTPKELAARRGCLACHAIDKTLVGPAYQDIAKKYSAADEAKLIAKVKAGGSGVWGKIPMPPNPQVNDEELKRLVQWILAGAK